MTRIEIGQHLRDLQTEFMSIADRDLFFDEWLTAQCMELSDHVKSLKQEVNNNFKHLQDKHDENLRLVRDLNEYTTLYREFKDRYEFTLGRANALEEWLSEYRDDLKKGNVFHKNQGIINAINELLNEQI